MRTDAFIIYCKIKVQRSKIKNELYIKKNDELLHLIIYFGNLELMSGTLASYIKDARDKKLSDEIIKNNLIHAGWPAEEVNKALIDSADIPIPPPAPRIGMWTGFLYILFFISLCTVAVSMGFLYHLWVDNLFINPDEQSSFNYSILLSQGLIRVNIASIIVSLPIFSFLAYILNKHVTAMPWIRNLRIRKILIYIALIITFNIFFGHLIKIIYDFLGGSVTSNSLGHLVVTLVISGGIFFYYLLVIKDDRSIQK